MEISCQNYPVPGPCYAHCQMLLPFMVLLFFMTLMVAITQMPLLMVVLRSVAEEEKAESTPAAAEGHDLEQQVSTPSDGFRGAINH